MAHLTRSIRRQAQRNLDNGVIRRYNLTGRAKKRAKRFFNAQRKRVPQARATIPAASE